MQKPDDTNSVPDTVYKVKTGHDYQKCLSTNSTLCAHPPTHQLIIFFNLKKRERYRGQGLGRQEGRKENSCFGGFSETVSHIAQVTLKHHIAKVGLQVLILLTSQVMKLQTWALVSGLLFNEAESC